MTPKLAFKTIVVFGFEGYSDPRCISQRTLTKEIIMKVLAIASVTKPLSPEQQQQLMPNEVPATLKLYLDGKIEQFFHRKDAPGVIFIMNVESLEEARTVVDALPLAVAGFTKFELMHIGPLAPLGLLIKGN